MVTEIGITAGEIWHYLDQHESATLNDLALGIKRPNELILMSLGWLAREGHVVLEGPDAKYRARLTSPSK